MKKKKKQNQKKKQKQKKPQKTENKTNLKNKKNKKDTTVQGQLVLGVQETHRIQGLNIMFSIESTKSVKRFSKERNGP